MAVVIFALAALCAVAGGIGVITFREPIYCVLSTVVTMIAMAVLFLVLNAQFLFIAQIIVYAGAVMVLFLFVIALLGPTREQWSSRLPYQNPVGIVLAAALVSVILALLYRGRYHAYEVAVGSVSNVGNYALGTVQAVGAALFTRYLYPFELTSLLLLVAAVGAIYLSRGE